MEVMVESRELAFKSISRIVARKTPALICIDGPAGAGKTTLANEIEGEFRDVNVVHMDDLYDGWESPINENLANRIVKQIVEPHKAGLPLKYDKYDWFAGEFNSVEVLFPKSLLILEGVGSGSELIRVHADLLIFIEIDPDFGVSRVLKRDGNQISSQMQDWKIMQDSYFKNSQTKRAADVIIDGSISSTH